MTTFVDTSALFALLDEDDKNHRKAAAWLAGPGQDPAETLLTHNYIVVESAALAHRRLGRSAVRVLFDGFLPAVSVLYVDEYLHQRATSGYIAGLSQRTSFVDRVSFELMRERNVVRAFAFDRDFATQGFESVA